MSHEGKVALVTGAGNGIGKAACLAYSAAGARVFAVDINGDAALATRDAIRASGGEAEAHRADVSQAAEAQAYTQKAIRQFGRIDCFFNNAGIEGVVASTMEYPEDVFDRVMAINLKGVFLGLKYVLPYMVDKGCGSVVNASSVGGVVGAPGLCAYSASKHAIIGLTRTAAAEVAQYGLRVNAVCPSAIETRMIDSLAGMYAPDDPESARAEFISRNPSRRYGLPEEVARAVLFLTSDAASFVNGEALMIDGGRTAV